MFFQYKVSLLWERALKDLFEFPCELKNKINLFGICVPNSLFLFQRNCRVPGKGSGKFGGSFNATFKESESVHGALGESFQEMHFRQEYL